MSDSVTRFSSRVEDYAKYRPTYPAATIDLLRSDCGLNGNSIIADVGSGTGILSEFFLRNGNRVLAVEPNASMREVAERSFQEFKNFVSIDATAEATTLEPSSVDFITAAQAFHWFEPARARAEFSRILKPEGWVVLIWNERRVASTRFLRDYEDLLLRYGTDYSRVRHENVDSEIEEFYAPQTFTLKSFENLQHFDYEGLKGRTRSASYTPEPGDPNFEPMFSRLQEIFNAHSIDGMVTVEYDTRVYYGRLIA